MKTQYLGFHRPEELPIKRGQELTIPKGTIYQHRGKLHETRRAHKVKVQSVLGGMSYCVGHRYNDGDVRFSYSNRRDRDNIKAAYGTDVLAQLWPLMTIRENSLFLPISNPEVTWAGAGGYWSDADINQFVTE